MDDPLRILIVEDSDDDALLLVRELRRGGFQLTYELVETAETLQASLAAGPWDIVMSDYQLPVLSGPAALEIVQTIDADLPFIIVSGTIGNDVAVAAMKAGAHDYILKDNLQRLVPAVRRELREAGNRRARKRADKNYRDLLESVPDGIVAANHEGRIRLVNEQAGKMFGYRHEELLGQEIEILVPERLRSRKSGLRSVFSIAPTAPDVKAGLELYGLRKNGTEFPIEINLRPIEDEAGILISSAIRDITERKHLEQQLRQSQKMEAIGRLAGAVAHDFNNLLTVILGFGQLALERLNHDTPERADMEQLLAAADRAASLTRQLLAFSRQQALQPTVLDLNGVIANMEKMLKRLIGKHIEVIFVPCPGLGRVKADAGQIEQVIMNLVLNASDAMPEGGKLIIETANVELGETYTNSHIGAKPGSYTMLAVSDTGCGMDAETRARIFEPFFTSKEKGCGTGLGLSTVFGIVKQSDGNIWVYSEPGRGTTFKIYLPQVQDSPPAAKTPEATPRLLKGTETILVVEDEDSVRGLVHAILEANGYKVLIARRGEEALSVSSSYPDRIELMVSDLAMPGMNGRELAKSMASLRPEMRILSMSGYADDSIVRHDFWDANLPHIQKPFTPEVLVRKVRELLDGTPDKTGRLR